MTTDRDRDWARVLANALSLHESGRLADAEPLYHEILRSNPQHFEAIHYLGILRFQQGSTDEALKLINSALTLDTEYAEALYNRGNILAALNLFEDALASYDSALASQPNRPEAHLNRGNALFKLRRFEDAISSYDRALAVAPHYAEAWNGRGTALMELGRFTDALDCYDHVLAFNPSQPDALYNRGNALKAIKRYEDSIGSYDKARSLEPNHPDKYGGLDCFLAICDFARTMTMAEGIVGDLRAGKPSIITPFTLVGFCDEPEIHLKAARHFVSDAISILPKPLWDSERYKHERIRLGYLSADFKSHPVASLIVELLELHDRDRFEVHAFSFERDNGSMRARITTACDRFYNVENESSETIARQVREQEIDIAIDLMGFTRGSRLDVFAHRPAPLQVNYLGYPGTTGADFMDYVVADETVVPSGQERFYSENVVHLPNCYQVNDRKRAIADTTPTRLECGLPENGIVFCCFNNNYKIRKPIFDVWMRLLASVPRSVLWLLRDNDGAERNLRKEAAARGVDPTRLIFAQRATPAEHLARHRQADIFLDTLPYNAHTTASDALWMGLPIVTCQGRAFAGRVASSLLKAVGLPELVTDNLSDYEALALRLATDPAELSAIRRKLVRGRLTQPLFDTDKFRRNIEAAYVHMWTRWQRGEPPRAFRVANEI
jgi:predicted O-linked N-acetylglucosamine transferase (SPINDLY family)